jgi:hypothetical protein
MTNHTATSAFLRDNRVIFFYIVREFLRMYQPVMQVSATLRTFAGRSAKKTNYLTLLLAAGQKESVVA